MSVTPESQTARGDTGYALFRWKPNELTNWTAVEILAELKAEDELIARGWAKVRCEHKGFDALNCSFCFGRGFTWKAPA